AADARRGIEIIDRRRARRMNRFGQGCGRRPRRIRQAVRIRAEEFGAPPVVVKADDDKLGDGADCALKLRRKVDQLFRTEIRHQLVKPGQFCGRIVLRAEVKNPTAKPVTEPGRRKAWFSRKEQARGGKQVQELDQRLVLNETAEHDASSRVRRDEIKGFQNFVALCALSEYRL